MVARGRAALGPGGHQQLRRRCFARALDFIVMAARGDRSAAHRLAERLNQRGKIERRVNVLSREEPHDVD
jgi:hypothetical protein